jgi:predicted membrane channel-forming protein YqfA (hemolysin III family)
MDHQYRLQCLLTEIERNVMKNTQATITTESPESTIEHVSRFTPQEEIANAASHFLGAGFSLVAIFYLLYYMVEL